MGRAAAPYVCQACGAVHRRWMGRCDACGAWNTVIEEPRSEAAPRSLAAGKGRRLDLHPLVGESPPAPRRVTGIAEFDRVCGGGLVAGSTVLVAGDPGIGKSTLCLQAAASLAANEGADRLGCAYVSGEESIEQVRLRALRLGLAEAPVGLASATSIRDILATLDAPRGAGVVVIDSIQTMDLEALDSAPGSIAQVRASAQALMHLAKRRGVTVLMVGHVTKEGLIAGPRVLEHMVDTVLYFEGERSHQFRILRAVKNRFGPTDEIGVFEMTNAGLIEVPNPSALFLGEHESDVSGAAVFAGMEGTRPVLVEIQALVAPSPLATPRRAVVGWDGARLAMVMAVLEARCGLALSAYDVYLSVAGGLRISEPAADLAVAAALVSSLADVSSPPETVFFGEVGLSGEIRPVGQTEARLKEAAKLGFTRAIVPKRRRASRPGRKARIEVREVNHLQDLVALLGAAPKRVQRNARSTVAAGPR